MYLLIFLCVPPINESNRNFCHTFNSHSSCTALNFSKASALRMYLVWFTTTFVILSSSSIVYVLSPSIYKAARKLTVIKKIEEVGKEKNTINNTIG